MKVLIDQQFHLGHHYQYIAHLLPALVATSADIVVAVTTEGRESEEFTTFLAPFAGAVRFEAILPHASPWLPFKERWRVHRDLRAVVRTIRPDYVLIPSGDAQATAMGAFRLGGLGGVPGRLPCEVGIHFGAGSDESSTAGRLKDRLNLLNLSVAGLKRVHLVNFLFYEQIANRGGSGPFTLMPHPIARPVSVRQADARHALGLPVDGRYIGLAASIDSRKAVKEFLAAFRASAKPGERLLLAGQMNQTHARGIREGFSDLLDSGRVILLNRFLTPQEYQSALAALDVVCTPYPRFGGLSSTLLEGVAAGRPVLANGFGWSREVVNRFGLGWTCDVQNHDEFSAALRLALDRCGDFRHTEAASRLLQFHAADNFAAHWAEGVRRAMGRPADRAKSWEWVLASLPAR